MPLVTLLIIPIAGSVVAAFLPPQARNRAAGVAGLATLTPLAALVEWFPRVNEGAAVVERIDWVPALNLNLVLRLDGLSWLFCVVVLGIGALVTLYARYYLSLSDPVPRFYAFLQSHERRRQSATDEDPG